MRNWAVRTVGLGVLVFGVWAQGQGDGQKSAQGPIYTVGADTRLVIEDVSVTDKSGNAVKGLPASAFHVTDDAAPQRIAAFEESSESVTKPAPIARPGVFSNAAVESPGGNIVVLLIDPVGMDIPDQMFLRLQMLKYVATMPEGLQAAVFKTYGSGRPLLVQSLTTDHALLVKAIEGSVPTITLPVSTRFGNALAEVANISSYLAQMPGRKELIWFSGKFPLFQSPLAHTEEVEYTQAEEYLKLAYRLLEKARVEVFPIDCRGVTMGGPPLNEPGSEKAMHQDPSVHGTSTIGEGEQDAAAYDAMDSMAAATGGRAFYSTNGLADAMRKAVDMGDHSYTLSYHPSPYKQDGSWHKVKLTVDGPYKVSYRQGYYADEMPGSPGMKQTVEGEKQLATLVVAQAPRPIVFDAKLSEKGAGGKGTTRFLVEYGIAAKDLEFALGGDGREQAQVKVAAMAYDWNGDVVSSAVDTMQTHFDQRQMAIAGRVGVPMLQEIDVARRAKYLLLAVFDVNTGRTGTVQLTMDSAKAPHP